MDRTITVKGIGKVSIKPDLIILSMTINTLDKDYGKSMAVAANQLEALRAAITSVGFSKDDLKTTNFTVDTKYDNRQDQHGNYQRVFQGFQCSHQLKLEFGFNTIQLGDTLAAISHCSAKPEFSIRFSVKDKQAVSDALLRDAAENARKKAVILCEASSVKLGDLISIDYNWGELNVFSPTRYEMEDRCLSAAPCGAIDIEPDDINTSDTVTFVWRID